MLITEDAATPEHLDGMRLTRGVAPGFRACRRPLFHKGVVDEWLIIRIRCVEISDFNDETGLSYSCSENNSPPLWEEGQGWWINHP